MATPMEEGGWDDLLLDGLPDVGLEDFLQLDCGLSDPELPPGLDGLDYVGGGGAAGADPASSDLLESLLLDAAAFSYPAGSSGARHSPSSGGSGSDSPLALPLMVPAPGPQLPLVANGASPATSESENNHGGGRGSSGSPAATGSQGKPLVGSPGQHQQQTAQQGTQQPPPQQQRNMSEDEKRLARMQRNRENAQLSRQRKKQQMSGLEQRCAVLQQQNVQLSGAVQRLTAENAALRQQLVLVCQQAGRATAAATAAGAAKPATVAAAAAAPATAAAAVARPAAPAAAPAAAAAKGLLPQWPLLPFGLLPKAAIAAQQQQQRTAAQQPAAPAAAPAAPAAAAAAAPTQPAAAAAAAAAAAGRAPKRARTAAGASTAFLALFSLFMFAGPFGPAPITTPSGTPTAAAGIVGAVGSQRTLQALPQASAGAAHLVGSEGGGGGGLHHGGRGLQALPAAASEGPLPQPHQQPHIDLEGSSHSKGHHHQQQQQLGAGGGGNLQRLLNSTLQALLLEPGNAQLEAAALQRLQELGPVALLLDADDSAGAASANPLAASRAFPDLAGQLFGSAGLEVPQMCQKVLEFDAASVPHAARSRRSLERFVLGATGFRGRSLAAGSSSGGRGGALHEAAGPQVKRVQPKQEPVRIEEPGGEEEEEEGRGGGSGGGSKALLPTKTGAAAGPVLVSVLLPANASGGGGGGSAKLAAVDKVFVVLLHPQERYVTYSCMLPRPVVL